MAKKQAPPPTPEELSAEEQAVNDSAKKLAEAKVTLAAAQAEHDAAAAEHAEATKALEPKAEVGKHILVDTGASGSYAIRDLPAEFQKTDPIAYPRSLKVDGVNVEHVGENEDGIWQYRRM